MDLKKLNSVLEKAGIDAEEIKDEIVTAVKDEVKEEVEKTFSEDGQKILVDKINKAVNIPFLNEKQEEKLFTAMFKIIKVVLAKRIWTINKFENLLIRS